mmetsp:Transcript_7630/g.13759  ORF Transcript_7630/g.13759 Transcript_7630/m.13759 type:complete len:91 (+) Transcript_7630:228-500(+)
MGHDFPPPFPSRISSLGNALLFFQQLSTNEQSVKEIRTRFKMLLCRISFPLMKCPKQMKLESSSLFIALGSSDSTNRMKIYGGCHATCIN